MTELTDEQYAKIAARIQVLKSQKADIDEAIDNLNATLIGAIGETDKPRLVGNNELGYANVSIFQGKQFSGDLLKRNAPELWERAAEPAFVVTSAHAKAVLSTEEYAKGQKPNDKWTVKVDAVND